MARVVKIAGICAFSARGWVGAHHKAVARSVSAQWQSQGHVASVAGQRRSPLIQLADEAIDINISAQESFHEIARGCSTIESGHIENRHYPIGQVTFSLAGTSPRKVWR